MCVLRFALAGPSQRCATPSSLTRLCTAICACPSFPKSYRVHNSAAQLCYPRKRRCPASLVVFIFTFTFKMRFVLLVRLCCARRNRISFQNRLSLVGIFGSGQRSVNRRTDFAVLNTFPLRASRVLLSSRVLLLPRASFVLAVVPYSFFVVASPVP